jgi:hypothetical protein
MRPVLFAGCFLFGGLALSRSLATLATGEVSPYTAFGLCFEWTSTALAIWLVRAQPASPSA